MPLAWNACARGIQLKLTTHMLDACQGVILEEISAAHAIGKGTIRERQDAQALAELPPIP